MSTADITVTQQSLHPVAEARALLRVGHTKAWSMIREGTLETIRIGRRRLVRGASILKVFERGAA